MRIFGRFQLKTQGTTEIIHREGRRHDCVAWFLLTPNMVQRSTLVKAVKIVRFCRRWRFIDQMNY